MKSKYSKRLFRHLADWRKTGFVKDTAEELEQEVLILDSPSLLRSKGAKLQQAMDEINTLLVDEHGTSCNTRFDSRANQKKENQLPTIYLGLNRSMTI